MLLNYCRNFNHIRLVYSGSIECFDAGNGPITEDSPILISSPYSSAKTSALLATKTYRESYNLHASTAILSNHESPLRPCSFVIQKIISNARRISAGDRSKFSLGNTNIIRDWGWAPEYMEALVLMGEAAKPNDFVVSPGVY